MATHLELAGAVNESAIKDNAKGALMIVASEVLTETPTPSNHAERVAYARQVQADPEEESKKWVPQLLGLNKELPIADILALPEATALQQVRDNWDLFV